MSLSRVLDKVTTFLGDLGAPEGRTARLPYPVQLELLAEARDSGGEGRHRAAEGTTKVHAHSTNSAEEMRQALKTGTHSVEGDVSVVRGVPILRHDPKADLGMPFSMWLRLSAAADFEVVKVDVKRDQVGPIIHGIREAIANDGLNEERIKLNADLFDGPGARAGLSLFERFYIKRIHDMELELDDIKALRDAFPRAAISIGCFTGKTPPGTRYTPEQIDRFIELAREIGGPITFPLRWDLIDRDIIDKLKPHGRIDVWNMPDVAAPADIPAETKRLTALGVDVVDLRPAA